MYSLFFRNLPLFLQSQNRQFSISRFSKEYLQALSHDALCFFLLTLKVLRLFAWKNLNIRFLRDSCFILSIARGRHHHNIRGKNKPFFVCFIFFCFFFFWGEKYIVCCLFVTVEIYDVRVGNLALNFNLTSD